MEEGSAFPGTLPKFVFPVLGTVPFRWSAERFQQNRTSKQNSDQPAEYTNQLYIIFFSVISLLSFLHNLEGEQTCHIII
jgi:hypothetical protein